MTRNLNFIFERDHKKKICPIKLVHTRSGTFSPRIRIWQRLVRQGKILSLSTAGQLYFPTVQRIFCSLDAISAKTMGQLSGITRLAVYSSFALKWLVPKLPEFRKMHPEIDLRLTMVTESDIDLDLLGVDCGISIRCDNPAYHFNHLRSEEWFPVCSPDLYDDFSQLPFHDAILRYALLEGEHQNHQNQTQIQEKLKNEHQTF